MPTLFTSCTQFLSLLRCHSLFLLHYYSSPSPPFWALTFTHTHEYNQRSWARSVLQSATSTLLLRVYTMQFGTKQESSTSTGKVSHFNIIFISQTKLKQMHCFCLHTTATLSMPVCYTPWPYSLHPLTLLSMRLVPCRSHATAQPQGLGWMNAKVKR